MLRPALRGRISLKFMEVLALTIFFSTMLVLLFVLLFLLHHQKEEGASLEQQALLPLEQDSPRTSSAPQPRTPHH